MRRLCLLFLLAASSAAAQTAPAVPNLTGSTRALGLGGAFHLGGTDSDAIFYNPAYGDRLRGASLGVQWHGSESTLYSASAGIDWFGGAIGIGLLAVDDVSTSERAALLTHARRLFGLRVAVTGKLLEQRTGAERNATAAADLAAAHTISFLTLGLAAQNLGPGIEVAGVDHDLPMRALFNAATQATVIGPLDASAALQVSYVRDGEVIPAGGVELSYWPVSGRTFSARLGARRTAADEEWWTVGAGFSGDRIVLDYAFDGDAHRLGVRWR